MKSLFIAICLMASMLSQSSQAAEPITSTRVLRAFETTFTEADDAHWSQVGNLYKVDFRLDDRSMFAFYNTNGELVVTGKYLKTTQLPKATQKKLAEIANGYTITEVFEIHDGLDIKYYATLINETGQKIMESSGGKWSTFEKKSN